MRYTALSGESQEYVTAREELRKAELALMQQQERVAEMRRALPEGPVLEDYEFLEGPSSLEAGDTPVRSVRLSELFTSPGRALVVYHFMFGKRQTSACPMCTMWIDGYNAIVPHLAQNLDFVVAAAADPAQLRAHARGRGWGRLRLLSCGSNTFKADLGSEDQDGNQDSTLSVFTRDASGPVRHFYTTRPAMGEDVNERGIDHLTPVYNMLDLTPRGRGDWYASLSYPEPVGSRTVI